MLSLSLRRGSKAGFRKYRSATFAFNEVAENSYSKFRHAYVKNCQALNESLDGKGTQAAEEYEGSTVAYVHPHQSEFNPITFGADDLEQTFHDFVGPEQVSPHYENFAMSRKWAIGITAGCVAFNVLGGITDLHWIMASSLVPFFYWTYTSYWFLEGKSSLVMPLFNRFYSFLASHEMDLLQTYWVDNMRESIRENMQEARSQMDYYQVHSSYDEIKAESVNRFLANEQVNLKIHIHERAEDILKTVAQTEAQNKRNVITNVVSEAIEAVEEALVENEEYIKEQSFQSAILGIRNKGMTYEGDAVLPIVQEAIKSKILTVTSLTEQEQLDLVILSKDQLKTIKAADERARSSFVETQPAIEGSLKEYATVKEVLDSWGQ